MGLFGLDPEISIRNAGKPGAEGENFLNICMVLQGFCWIFGFFVLPGSEFSLRNWRGSGAAFLIR